MPYRPHRVACKDLGRLRLMPPAWMTALTMLVADHTKDNVPQCIYVAISINIVNFISIVNLLIL